MSNVTSMDVRCFLKTYLDRKLQASGRAALEDLPDDCDLLVSGVIDDSVGFLDLLLAIEEFTGHEMDFDVLDPEKMSVVGPLCNFVSEQTRNPQIAGPKPGLQPQA